MLYHHFGIILINLFRPFFQNIGHHMKNDGFTINDIHNDKILREVFQKFVSQFYVNHTEPLDEEEDILSKIPFHMSTKRIVLKKNNVTYVKLRFHDIHEWDRILSECFGRPISVHSNNMTSAKKNIYPVYKKFLEQNQIIPREFYELCFLWSGSLVRRLRNNFTLRIHIHYHILIFILEDVQKCIFSKMYPFP